LYTPYLYDRRQYYWPLKLIDETYRNVLKFEMRDIIQEINPQLFFISKLLDTAFQSRSSYIMNPVKREKTYLHISACDMSLQMLAVRAE
jgi:hypothetical protein